MKVLMIEHFSPGNLYTVELCQRLCHHADITLLCRANAYKADETIDQKACLYAGGRSNKLIALAQYCRGMLALYRELNSGEYQVVHVQTFKNAYLEIPVYRRMKRRFGKLVHTVHNILPHEPRKKDKELYGWFYRDCDALIVHNVQSKKRLIELFGIEDKKIFIIPIGAYSMNILPRQDKVHDKIHYLLFGVIRRYKGIDILLQAISMIPEKLRSSMVFVIAGKQYMNQDDTDYAQMIEELNIGDCVRFIQRRIDDTELPALFNWADVCLLPYREIYGSGALLMAYTYRKPVIVSDVPSFVEETAGGRTGLLFKNENAASLSDALIAFSHLNQDDIGSMISSIDDLVCNKYNWAVLAKMTAGVYNRAIEMF